MKSRHDRFFSHIRDKLERIDDIASDELTIHKKVLYVTYIDSLVHDFRALGPGYNWAEDQASYYISTHTSSASNDASELHWELVYPLAFLRTLSQSALAAFETHIRGNQVDPTGCSQDRAVLAQGA